MLLIALLLGISTFIISYNLLSLYIKTEKIVIANRNLEPYTKITAKDLKIVEIPQKGLHPDRIHNIDVLVGSYNVAPLIAGQILLTGHFLPSDAQPGISNEITGNERGMFIPVGIDHAVGGLINEGDKVDLIWSLRGTNLYQTDKSYTGITVLNEAKVIKVVNSRSDEFKGIVIAVTPKTCEKLAYYLEIGNMYLAIVPWTADNTTIDEGAEVWLSQ